MQFRRSRDPPEGASHKWLRFLNPGHPSIPLRRASYQWRRGVFATNIVVFPPHVFTRRAANSCPPKETERVRPNSFLVSELPDEFRAQRYPDEEFEMTPEQEAQLRVFLATLPEMSVDQLFEALHKARCSKAAAPEDAAPYWRALMIGVGEQLHRRLGPGALQEYAKRYNIG
jgi:hypothetical protein